MTRIWWHKPNFCLGPQTTKNNHCHEKIHHIKYLQILISYLEKEIKNAIKLQPFFLPPWIFNAIRKNIGTGDHNWRKVLILFGCKVQHSAKISVTEKKPLIGFGFCTTTMSVMNWVQYLLKCTKYQIKS